MSLQESVIFLAVMVTVFSFWLRYVQRVAKNKKSQEERRLAPFKAIEKLFRDRDHTFYVFYYKSVLGQIHGESWRFRFGAKLCVNMPAVQHAQVFSLKIEFKCGDRVKDHQSRKAVEQCHEALVAAITEDYLPKDFASRLIAGLKESDLEKLGGLERFAELLYRMLVAYDKLWWELEHTRESMTVGYAHIESEVEKIKETVLKYAIRSELSL